MGYNKLPTERRDAIDRIEQKAAAKLTELCEMVKQEHGEDPRGGGWSFVGKPIIVATCLKELPAILRILAPKMMVSNGSGRDDADVVFFWGKVKIRVRNNAKGNVLHAVRDSALPPSRNGDRRDAGEMRFAAWKDQQS